MQKFKALVQIVDINPYVEIPANILKNLQREAKNDKGPIPVKEKLQGIPFKKTVVKFRGLWRLYLNTQMRVDSGVDVGDGVIVEIEFDKKPRIVPMPAKFAGALAKNKRARAAFKKLTPSRQKEINLYSPILSLVLVW